MDGVCTPLPRCPAQSAADIRLFLAGARIPGSFSACLLVHRIRTQRSQSALPHCFGPIILALNIDRKEHSISELDNRVLGRAGARLVTEQELQEIKGAVQTFVCSIDPTTGAKDGDACH
jgi:hypothetical protein